MKYYSLNQYLKDTFGCKVYKISLDAGLSCPNRDGTIDTRGCIFCSNGGSGEFAEKIHSVSDVKKQLDEGKKRIVHKNKNGKYIAYFQAFTNTYGPIDYLEKIFTEAIMTDDIVALSIATRPDCLDDEILNLLNRLNKIKPVWVELGLQTIHEQSAKYIRRGYSLDVFDMAVEKLNQINIDVIVHIILGLPDETKEDMLETTNYVAAKKIQGIKFQLLHVLKDTDLATDYENKLFDVLSLEEYVDIVVSCLKILPPQIVVHRITGDGDKKLLIAPKWSADKKKVLNTLNNAINTSL